MTVVQQGTLQGKMNGMRKAKVKQGAKVSSDNKGKNKPKENRE